MSIIDNRKAHFDYHIEERYEAGNRARGLGSQALRAGRGQIREGYVVIKHAEIFLIGTHISPLPEASTHITPDPVRTRKLLLHREEIKTDRQVEQRGYTLVPLNFHYKGGRVKCDIALAKGKKLHDKRETEKKRDWNAKRPASCAPAPDLRDNTHHDTARSKRAVLCCQVNRARRLHGRYSARHAAGFGRTKAPTTGTARASSASGCATIRRTSITRGGHRRPAPIRTQAFPPDAAPRS